MMIYMQFEMSFIPTLTADSFAVDGFGHWDGCTGTYKSVGEITWDWINRGKVLDYSEIYPDRCRLFWSVETVVTDLGLQQPSLKWSVAEADDVYPRLSIASAELKFGTDDVQKAVNFQFFAAIVKFQRKIASDGKDWNTQEMRVQIPVPSLMQAQIDEYNKVAMLNMQEITTPRYCALL